MDVNTEELTYEDSTPIKNSKENIVKETTDCYESDDVNSTVNSCELFSDNENENENENDLIYCTPIVSKTETSFLNISETSLLDTSKLFQTPVVEKPAVIPSTPLSLLPFISKVNEQWTSDLETPQMDKNLPRKPTERNEQSAYFKECTPNNSNFKNVFNESVSTSPVINCTRMKRRTKRRIFKNTSVIVNDDNSALNNQDNENDIVTMDTCDDTEKQNILLESNSAQDFFSDASFDKVDQVCANFAEKNDTYNVESNSKRRRFMEVMENNITVLGKNCTVDKNECDEKEILNSDNKITLSVTTNNIGFSTASGKHINISESAVSKAKCLLEKDDTPSMGFSTASGKQISVSESAISKAKSLLETDDITSLTNIYLDNESNVRNNYNTKNVSSSFVTAGGQSLNISNKALSKAKKMLFEDLEDIQINENITNELNKSSIDKSIVSKVGFKTAAGREVVISKEALNRAEIFLSDDTNDTNQCNNLLNKSINKRKSLHLCDNTVDKLSFSTKKVRLSNKDITEEKERETNSQSNIFSNEIMASTAALLADERDNDQTMEWISQADNCEKETPSSPVIGRQPTARKRSRKRCLQNSLKQKLKPLIKSDISGNVNEENVQFDDTSKEELISMQETNLKPNFDLPIDNVTDILQKRFEFMLEQEKIIKEKKLNRPKAIKGKLLSYKEKNYNSRLTWKKLVGNDVPSLYTFKELIDRDISSEILTITATTASLFKFRCIDFYGEEIINNNSNGLEMEDGGYLIPDKDNCIGISEMKRSFLASPGVDPSLIPRDWIENHYKWIIWKLASMDRIKFKFIDIPRSLTPVNVMLQLKYRYDREIDRLQRPCLRRILEKDDCASKRMVLCVSSITEFRDDENIEISQIILNKNHWKMILTDGWYSIPAFIDTIMMGYISSGKIREGTKLMIFGAELLNLDQGCSPLEIPHDVSLKIHTNSTRRTKWDTKLGYTRCPGPMLIKLKDVCSNGGLIGKLKVMITRTYPMLYHEKNPSGESIFRNSRCEEKANLAFEEQYRLKVEAFYAEAEQKFDSARNDNFDSDDIDLNEENKKLINHNRVVEEFKQELESKFRENMPPPRQVSSVLKVRINEDNTSAILTIWAPSEDIIDIFKEGTRISINNVTASGKRSGDLQLTASRSTIFNKEEVCKDFLQSRIYTPLQSITDHSFNPLYGEFDTIGIVSSIINCPYGMRNFDAVNIACPLLQENLQENDSLESSYLSILFWQGVSTFGYTEILTVGSLVACSNLEWRCATSWSIPIAYCTDRSVFTRNPRHNHLCQAFENIKNLIKIPYTSYAANCAEHISLEIQKKTNLRTHFYITPDKNTTPGKEKLNTSDISISIGSNSCSDTRNSNSIRSAALQRRLEKLRCYNNPPELSPIVLKNVSSRVSLDFRSPLRDNNLKPTKLNVDL
ncbi:hypothetical protein M0802_009546 [Mischocyttarus mexicanus]|nr:hypothetical protein M0802_009546 [Mischocyttarus mexicanus]